MSCEVRALVPLPIPRTTIVRRVNGVLRRLKYNVRATDVSVVLIDDRRMRELNQRYRQKRGTTDVLSFPGAGDTDLGELLISVPQARRQAKQYGTTLPQEIELLLIHGLLHLAGYDHERSSDRATMQALEHRLLTGRSLIGRAYAQD